MYMYFPQKLLSSTASLRLRDYTTKKVTSYEGSLLKTIFDDNPNPSLLLRNELASAMGVKLSSINKWFYRQRKKCKKLQIM